MSKDKKSPGIHEVPNGYKIVNQEGGGRLISNFVLRPTFEVLDNDNFKYYLVEILRGKKTDGPYTFTSKDWKSQYNFREWLGKCSGTYSFTGSNPELNKIINYCFQNFKAKPIKIVTGYGNLEEGVWIFDNGAIKNGKIIKADEYGISWAGERGTRTKTWGGQKTLNIPDKFFSVEKIMENLVKFYNKPTMIWTAIGYATATIFFRPISRRFGCFPVLFCYGPRQSGKTRFARITASLCGGGPLEVPNSESTVKGLHKYICANHSLPIVINEFGGAEREKLICAFYDLDPYFISERSADLATRSFGFNSSGILTAIKPPEREDVLSRLITIDFNNYKKKNSNAIAFLDYYFEGVFENKNFGFLYELIQHEVKDDIFKLIKRVIKGFSKHIPDLDARQQTNFGILFGCFLYACDVLDLYSIFEKLGVEAPTQKQIINSFEDLANITTRLMEEQREIRAFFEIIESLHARGKVEDFVKFDTNGENDGEYVEFHLSSLYPLIKKEDRMTGEDKLKGLSRSWISNHLKIEFGVKARAGSINSKPLRLHRVYLIDIQEKHGLDMDIGNKSKEEQEEDRKSGKIPF